MVSVGSASKTSKILVCLLPPYERVGLSRHFFHFLLLQKGIKVYGRERQSTLERGKFVYVLLPPYEWLGQSHVLTRTDSDDREVNMPVALATIWERPFEIHKAMSGLQILYVTVISVRECADLNTSFTGVNPSRLQLLTSVKERATDFSQPTLNPTGGECWHMYSNERLSRKCYFKGLGWSTNPRKRLKQCVSPSDFPTLSVAERIYS